MHLGLSLPLSSAFRQNSSPATRRPLPPVSNARGMELVLTADLSRQAIKGFAAASNGANLFYHRNSLKPGPSPVMLSEWGPDQGSLNEHSPSVAMLWADVA